MKKLMVLWLAAVALTLSMGIGFAAARNSDGMHGHGGVRRRAKDLSIMGFIVGLNPTKGLYVPMDLAGSTILIGIPGSSSSAILFWAPIYYAPPLYTEQYPPVYVAPGVNYSYYCTDPSGYYPQIQYCPNGWLRVVPDISPD
ncbi:hypothetical protein ACFS07_27530 [Undibacterium arcticum]